MDQSVGIRLEIHALFRSCEQLVCSKAKSLRGKGVCLIDRIPKVGFF